VVVGTGERRRRYIVCRNQEEAKRQRHHRAEILTALKAEVARLDPNAAAHSKRACELVASARYGPYLTRGPGGRLAIDADAVRAAERLDGKYVLLTNDDTLTPEDVGLGYKSMMIIEACFRRMKATGLRIRPVYHWTAHRIVSHVKLCVLALLIERAAELRTGDTWRNLRLALDELKAVRYQVQGTAIAQSTRPTPQAAAILKKLKISLPSLVLATEQPPSASATT
jgi:transposase